MKPRYWLLLILIFILTPCYAQTSKITELQQQLNKNNADTARLRLLRQLSDAYTSVDPVKKFYYANVYKSIAEKLHDGEAVADAYLSMGVSYGIRSRLDSAMYYFKLAYAQAKKSNYPLVMGKSLSDMGFAYDRLDNKKEAIQSYFRALGYLKKAHFLRGINQCYTNIGSIYYDLQQYHLAESYFNQCLKASTENKDEPGVGYALFTLGNCYQAMGEDNKALNCLTKSLAIRQKLGDINGEALVRKGLGLVYLHKKQYDKAIKSFELALNSVRTLQEKYEESAITLNLTDVYLALHNYDKAESLAMQCLATGKMIKSNSLISETLEKLVNVYKGKNDIAKAFRYQSDYVAIQDSLLIQEAVRDVTMTEFSRIRTENEVLEKNNQVITSKNTDYLTRINRYGNAIIIIVIVLGFVTLLLLLFYRRNLEKQATNKVLLQQKEEIANINHELEMLNEELSVQMELTSKQNTELERLNNIKNKFFSIVSHDLRGPLGTLQTLLQVYRAGGIGEKEFNMLLFKLEDTILSTGTFLDNLLEWSKSQLEGIVITPESFNISECIAENIRLFETTIGLKQLSIINRTDERAPVYADMNMINLVIRNLLSNSIKFCSPGDTITLSAHTESDKTTISISDTGPGISEAERERLFSLEYTLSAGSQGEKGNRLGLILCRDMVIQNKGNIWFETKENAGTTFWIELPAEE